MSHTLRAFRREPVMRLLTSRPRDASLTASGADLEPGLNVLLTSSGTPRKAHSASSSFLSDERNLPAGLVNSSLRDIHPRSGANPF